MQRIIGFMEKANKEFNMIYDKDRIAVGVSGGKDSLILLEGICRLRNFLKYDIEIIAVTVDMGFGTDFANYEEIKKICLKYSVKYIIEETKIGEIVFKIKKEKHPCSLCSKMRRGIINTVAKNNGCNKVAFGHNFDDVLETFIMNLFVEGRIGCFAPVTYFSRQDIYLIRPLIFSPEDSIISAVKNLKFKPVKKICPKDGYTYRQNIKSFLKDMENREVGFKKRIFKALRKGGFNGWGFKYKK